jgi:hypothetical protein
VVLAFGDGQLFKPVMPKRFSGDFMIYRKPRFEWVVRDPASQQYEDCGSNHCATRGPVLARCWLEAAYMRRYGITLRSDLQREVAPSSSILNAGVPIFPKSSTSTASRF